MNTIEEYVSGADVTLSITLAGGAASDINLIVQLPNRTQQTYSNAFSSPTTGTYQKTLTTNSDGTGAGILRYRWYGTDALGAKFGAPADEHWKELFVR